MVSNISQRGQGFCVPADKATQPGKGFKAIPGLQDKNHSLLCTDNGKPFEEEVKRLQQKDGLLSKSEEKRWWQKPFYAAKDAIFKKFREWDGTTTYVKDREDTKKDIQNIINQQTYKLSKRAYYNKTQDLNTFNDILPVRSALLNNPTELKKYDQVTQDLMQHVKFLEEVPDSETEKSDKVPKMQLNSDPSEAYLYSAQIAEGLYKRPDLIQQLLKPNANRQALTVAFMQHPSVNHTDGTRCPQIIEIKQGSVAVNYGTAFHETVHELGGLKSEKTDDIPLGMTPKQEAQFITERDRLFKTVGPQYYSKIKSSKIGLPAGLRWLNLHMTDTMSVGEKLVNGSPGDSTRAYAFTNNAEFLAATAESFLTDPTRLKEMIPKLYSIYAEYFKQDPQSIYQQELEQIKTDDLKKPKTYIPLKYDVFS